MRMVEKRTLLQWIVFVLVCLIAFSNTAVLSKCPTASHTQSDLVETHVGVYNGEPVQGPSALALKHMFEWMGCTATWLDGEAIRNGTLENLDIVVFGGGSANNFAEDLGLIGLESIRQFIASGGSYFGVCGGGLFASDYLGICQGSWSQDIPGMPGGASLAELTVNLASTGPDLSNEAESYLVYFSNSPFFAPTNPASIISIMYYPTNDQIAMFVARYGSGTLFASGPHAEFEEGSNRDGLTAYDFLNDPDSEWEILQKITEWLIDQSPNNFIPETSGNIVFALGFLVGIILVVVGVVFYFQRKKRHT